MHSVSSVVAFGHNSGFAFNSKARCSGAKTTIMFGQRKHSDKSTKNTCYWYEKLPVFKKAQQFKQQKVPLTEEKIVQFALQSSPFGMLLLEPDRLFDVKDLSLTELYKLITAGSGVVYERGQTFLKNIIDRTNFNQPLSVSALEGMTDLLVGPGKLCQFFTDMGVPVRGDLSNTLRRLQTYGASSRKGGQLKELVDSCYYAGNAKKPIFKLFDHQFKIGTTSEVAMFKIAPFWLSNNNLGVVTNKYGFLKAIEEDKNKIFAIKVRKKNVNDDLLTQEQEILKLIVKALYKKPEDVAFFNAYLECFYPNWKNELDANHEKTHAEALRTLKYSTVNPVLDVVNKPGVIMTVMEKAEGVSGNDLLKMIKAYKADPEQYKHTYSEEIKQYPWLKNPGKHIEGIIKVFRQSINEQVFFSDVLHGDLQLGNIFFQHDDKTRKLKPVCLIDTASAITRTKEQRERQVKLFAGVMCGNADMVAKAIVDSVKEKGGYHEKSANFDKIEKNIKEQLNKYIFKAEGDVFKSGYFPAVLSHIFYENKILMSSVDMFSFKSIVAAINGYVALADAAGLEGRSFIGDSVASVLKQGLLDKKVRKIWLNAARGMNKDHLLRTLV